MIQLVSHIEFLLHEHNCVIVPGLGGFVVNTIAVQKEGLSNFHSPTCELVFNRNLTYNDGLLVESYMRVEELSFDAAQLKINSAVKQLKNTLRDEKSVSLGDLGTFKMINDQQFSYLPKSFVRPEYYGLTVASLKPVIQLQPKTPIVNKPTEIRRTTAWNKIGIATAAAAIISIILLIFPIQDTAIHHQTAQIINENGLFAGKTEKSKTASTNLTNAKNNTETKNGIENDATTKINTAEPSIIQNEHTEQISQSKYYIVAGVYEVRDYADKMIAQLKEEGYSNPSTIEKPGRITVFSESFPTIEEAYTALNKLVKLNKNHRDAWVLKR